MTAALARLNRLDRQEEFLKKRADKFLQSDVDSLEKLKKLKEKKNKQRETQTVQEREVERLLATIDDDLFDLFDSQLEFLDQFFVEEIAESRLANFANAS